LFGIERMQTEASKSISEWVKAFAYGQSKERQEAPKELCDVLGIGRCGQLTYEGEEQIMSFFSLKHRTYFMLTQVNDQVCTEDKTLYRIGEFIEHLLVLEYLFGQQMFSKP